MDKLRILIVTDWYPSPERPSLGTFVLQQARTAATRHDVAVIVSPAEGTRGRRLYELRDSEEDGLRTIRVRHRTSAIPKVGFLLRLAGALAAVRRLRRDGFEPQVLHAHIYGPGLVALVLGRLYRIPVVVSEQFSGIALGTVRGTELKIARFVYRHADLVCPASDDLRRRLEAYGDGLRLRVVPNPVDLTVFHPGTRDEGGPVRALAVAALLETKGISDLLQAVAAVRARRDDLVLEIVGDGPNRARYERQARELGLAGVVRFRGALPHPEVGRAMREASFLVHPSHWENLPNAVIEALASGLPVVATNVGGTPEIVRPHEGILVPPRDVTALSRAIEEMCGRFRTYDPDRLSQAAEARFGVAAVAARWTDVYEDLVASRGHGR